MALQIFFALNYLLFHEIGFRIANLLFSLSVAIYAYGLGYYALRFETLYILAIEVVAKYIYTSEMRCGFYRDGLEIVSEFKSQITKL